MVGGCDWVAVDGCLTVLGVACYWVVETGAPVVMDGPTGGGRARLSGTRTWVVLIVGVPERLLP